MIDVEPLRRDRVTVASRIMLPAYLLHFAWVGVSWLLTAEGSSMQTPALAYADGVVPLPMLGALLIGVAVMIAAAMLSGRRFWCRVALRVAGSVMGGFTLLFLDAYVQGDATASAGAWPFLVCAACFASEKSLLKGEVS